MVHNFEDLMEQVITGKRGDGTRSSKTSANEPTVNQGGVESCVEQHIREAERLGYGIEDVEDVYPEDSSGVTTSLEMSIGKDENVSIDYELMSTPADIKQAFRDTQRICRRGSLQLVSRDDQPNRSDQLEPMVDRLQNETDTTKEEQLESGASIERVKATQVAPEKMERFESHMGQVRVASMVRGNRRTMFSTAVMAVQK